MTDKLGPFELDKVHCIDCLEALPQLPDGSVQCCVTSPPYWGLRDYGLAPVVWDALDGCEHEWAAAASDTGNGDGKSFRRDKAAGIRRGEAQAGQFCRLCGAWRGSLGLEPTPELYVSHIVQMFREVRRVLRKDGTLWLNIGDSYGAQRGKGFNTHAITGGTNRVQNMQAEHGDIKLRTALKPKDLCMIPARITLALQADGYYLRSDIIWSKPNPMPESVTDRPTKAHEYIFLLTKAGRYYYDADAVREPFNYPERTYNTIPENHKTTKLAEQGNRSTVGLHDGRTQYGDPQKGRNLRTVWEFPTEPTPDAHFATFPMELPRRCIKAGTKPGDVVLDPFSGSGKTGQVALELGRRFIGFDLNPEYCESIAAPRIEAAQKGITVKELEMGQQTLFGGGNRE